MQTRKALAHIPCRPDQEQEKPIKFAHLANHTDQEQDKPIKFAHLANQTGLRNFLDIAPKKKNKKKGVPKHPTPSLLIK
jgi:hypothetical protein